MARIFENDLRKTTPHSLSECTRCPEIAQKIWSWARFFEKLGIVLLVIYIIVGIIISCACGGDDYCLSVVGGVVLGLTSYALCIFVALVIGSLASIVYDTSISASIAIYQSSGNPAEETTKEYVSVSASTPDPDPTPDEMNAKYWNCNKCGASNKKSSENCWYCGNYR